MLFVADRRRVNSDVRTHYLGKGDSLMRILSLVLLLLVLSAPLFAQTGSSPWKGVASKDDGETLYVHIKPQKNGNLVTAWVKLILPDGAWSIALEQYNCSTRRFRLLANVFLINGEALPGNSNFLPNGTPTAQWSPIRSGSAAAQVFSQLCLRN